jgi:uncharacterized protein (DUF433 family)
MGPGADPIAFFSYEDAARLTGLSPRRVKYWGVTRVLPPSAGRGGIFGVALYTFRDIVGLKVLARLRKAVSLQSLRRIGAWLSENHSSPWASLRFYVVGKQVYFSPPDDGVLTALDPMGQTAHPILVNLAEIADEARSEIVEFRKRKPDQHGKIVRDRRVHGNQPVLGGTRIPTATVWAFHKRGFSDDQIIAEFPSLSVDDVRAAIEYERSSHAA